MTTTLGSFLAARTACLSTKKLGRDAAVKSPVGSRRLVFEAGRTIENAKVGLMQNSRKRFRADEFAAHRSLQRPS
jgi:hypothetical protein